MRVREEAPRPAVFLDRDGTLHREVEGALSHPSQLELIPGSAQAIARLNEAGFAVALLTNQSAIARGWLDPERLAAVHAALRELLAHSGATLDLVLHCPHHPTEGFPPYRRACDCRKPGPGLLLEARRLLKPDWKRSWAIGDAARDLEAARRAGLRGILVETGKGEREREKLSSAGTPPEYCVADLAAAVEVILRGEAGMREEKQGR